MKLKPYLSTVLFTLCLSGSVASAQSSGSTTELKTYEFSHQGRVRTYHVAKARGLTKRPVLFVLHGGGGSGLRVADRTPFKSIADREGLTLVFPEGVSGNWNDGRGVPSQTGVDVTGVDDLGFFQKLFDRVVSRHGGDPKRLYTTGVSNGGTMSYRLGIELGDRIAGIAAVAANLPDSLAILTPRAALPVLIMNGTDDPLMLWEGTTGDTGGGTLSALDTFRYWVRNNRGGGRIQVRVTSFPDIAPNDSSTVEATAVSGLEAPVVLYTVQGGGHTLPSLQRGWVSPMVGPQNRDIEGAEEIWSFLSQHSR